MLNITVPSRNLTQHIVMAVIVVLVLVGIAKSFSSRNPSPTPSSIQQISKDRVSEKKEVNKQISIKFSDKKDMQLSYTIESAELLDEIVVRGQVARAAAGKRFFVLNIKVKNDQKQGYSINSRDFVRLQPEGKKDEWIAPEIHNDPVEVQAISTKSTRLGFPVEENVKTFELQVGEINGEKSVVKVEF